MIQNPSKYPTVANQIHLSRMNAADHCQRCPETSGQKHGPTITRYFERLNSIGGRHKAPSHNHDLRCIEMSGGENVRLTLNNCNFVHLGYLSY